MQNTLDPPGSIAILGGGPIGIEAALYARYLGYQVTLYEADRLVATLLSTPEGIPPELCVSPLGVAALAAQRASGGTSIELEVATHAQWASDYFLQLAETDLLRGRIVLGQPVTRIAWAPPLDDEEEDENADDALSGVDTEEVDSVPPDFLLFTSAADTEPSGQRFEAVIDARGSDATELGPTEAGAPLADYYFCLGRRADATCDYPGGLEQIRLLFAQLQDRPGLDVYGNLGGAV